MGEEFRCPDCFPVGYVEGSGFAPCVRHKGAEHGLAGFMPGNTQWDDTWEHWRRRAQQAEAKLEQAEVRIKAFTEWDNANDDCFIASHVEMAQRLEQYENAPVKDLWQRRAEEAETRAQQLEKNLEQAKPIIACARTLAESLRTVPMSWPLHDAWHALMAALDERRDRTQDDG